MKSSPRSEHTSGCTQSGGLCRVTPAKPSLSESLYPVWRQTCQPGTRSTLWAFLVDDPLQTRAAENTLCTSGLMWVKAPVTGRQRKEIQPKRSKTHQVIKIKHVPTHSQSHAQHTALTSVWSLMGGRLVSVSLWLIGLLAFWWSAHHYPLQGPSLQVTWQDITTNAFKFTSYRVGY